MSLHITKELNIKDKQYINDELYRFNLKHFPKDLGGRYEEICLFLKDDNGTVRGGILSEICWNWLEIHTFMIDEEIRKSGYGTKVLLEPEKIALEKECDFIKVDTLSFQALDFYKKNGYQVFGSIDNVGREFKHYYLKKELKNI
ncbi:GNAT family N-acetyltransferase [Peribacillus butanolivorans]|uniref:GNAT family N-acetyltransferase n=1 Tax=Peribacillus butanolivorans TaxID=421767 RepID=A0AAX0RT31_9BACI|nr:GNAT family N-acetyltransferase [Peribacillus butanolivorans]PEJ37133.1 GNAT family N-acetyltransferase [Peribacillus butanolivorans]